MVRYLLYLHFQFQDKRKILQMKNKHLLFLGLFLLIVSSCTEKEPPLLPTEKWTTYSTNNNLICNEVYDLTVDNDNNLWIGTEYGISKFDGGNFTSFTTQHGLIYHSVSCISMDNQMLENYAAYLSILFLYSACCK